MAGGSKNKGIGNNYEYRLADWFDVRDQWNGKRNPLSGASSQIEESVGKYDVRAWHDALPIFIQIEAKKKSRVRDPKKRNQINIKDEWVDKLEYYKDELLVFATDRSPHYTLIPLKRFFQILGRTYKTSYDKSNTYSGKKQFALKRELIDNAEDQRYHLKWRNQEYVALYLEDFIKLRETADLNDQLSFEDLIKRLTSLEKAIEFEAVNLEDLTYKQKRLLYSKLEELESGTLINPIRHAQEQFWLGGEAYILTCPGCSKQIYGMDLQKDGYDI